MSNEENLKKVSFLLKRLKNWENKKENIWDKDYNKLIKKVDDKQNKEILECLKNIVEKSEKNYIEQKEININNLEYKENDEEKLEKDIMFELQNNYPKDLKELEIKNYGNVLNLSINPGSTQKEGQEENSKEGKIDTIIPLYSFDLDEEMSKKINPIITKYKINEKYIWRKYYNPNFEIFAGINAKYPWVALKREIIEEEFKNILKAQSEKIIKENRKLENKYTVEEQNKDLEELMRMYDKEQKTLSNDTPLVFFNDLFWIADSNQDDLLSILEKYDKKDMNQFVKMILDLYIEKYKLKLIVVTNIKATEYIKNAINDKTVDFEEITDDEKECVYQYRYINNGKNIEKIVPIVFSGYLANGMDKFSKIRLKRDINKYYNNLFD